MKKGRNKQLKLMGNSNSREGTKSSREKESPSPKRKDAVKGAKYDKYDLDKKGRGFLNPFKVYTKKMDEPVDMKLIRAPSHE